MSVEQRTKDPLAIRLQAIAAEGVLVVVVSSDVVKFATEHHGDFWDPDAEGDGYKLKVADEQTWLESVAQHLNDELGEDGSTLLTQALDKAIYNAADQGEEGLKYEDD